ncbi:MAG TPA: hypothetical protein VFX48_00015 [Saprospiraceae bacterium]|nr:hypothetical protein [Saprospiraceae bacterium]
MEKIKKYALTISIALFLISLTQKAYCTPNNCGDSIVILLIGWFGAMMGGAALTWVANPLIFASWWLTKKHSRTAIYTSLFAFVICLSFLLFGSISDNENGTQNAIISYELGYWLWCASALTLVIGNALLHSPRFKESSRA